MPEKLRNLKIISILRILIMLFLGAVLITSITFIAISYRSALRAGGEEFSASSRAQQQRIETRLQTIESNLLELSSGYNVQAFFTRESRPWQLDHLNMVNSAVDLFFLSNPEVKGIGIVGQGGLRMFRSPNNSYYDAFYSLDRTDAILSPNPERRYLPYLYHDGITGEEVLFCVTIYPIYYYNTTTEGGFSMDFRGNVIALTDIKAIYGLDMRDNKNAKIQTVIRYRYDWSYAVDGAASPAPDIGDVKPETLLEFRDRKNSYYFFQKYEIPQAGLTALNFIPQQVLLRPLNLQVMKSLPVIAGIAVLYAVFCVLLARSISVPVSSIVSNLQKIGYGNLKERLEISNNNEVGFIASAINSMLDQIEVMTRRIVRNQEKLYKAEIYKNQANLRFYQAQISPHFLYNSLACIRSIAASHQIDEIQAIAESISNIMRYSLRDVTFVTISDELRCLSDYLDIIETRYNRRINLKISCGEGLFDAQCVKMLLQPIVENCVNHGLNRQGIAGWIFVRIGARNDRLTIRVTDNGAGIPPEKLAALNGRLAAEKEFDNEEDLRQTDKGISTNIGLLNIRNRLWLNFGKQCSIHIVSEPMRYTQVVVSLPVRFPEAQRPEPPIRNTDWK